MSIRLALQTAALLTLLFVANIMSDECEQDSKGAGYHFPRSFIIRIDGSNDAVINNETIAAKSLGDCRSTEEHAANMSRFFGDLGIDLSGMGNPYQVYDTPRFNITPYTIDEGGSVRVILSSFYEYAQVINAPMIYTSFWLFAKEDLVSETVTLPAGSQNIYGLLRFNDSGEDFCVEYTSIGSNNPVVEGNRYTLALDLTVKHENWGMGHLKGLLVATNGIEDSTYLMYFPGTKG